MSQVCSPSEHEWDRLAVKNGLPLMSPACVMAWWRHLAPSTAQPRTVVVRDDSRLIGIAPFYTDRERGAGRRDFRMPGIELAGRLAPLALPGRMEDVAGAIGELLSVCQPHPDVVSLKGVPLEPDWAASLRDHWPGPAIAWRYQMLASPIVTLNEESFDAWLKSKSSNFRSQMRRMRRQFTAAGGTVRASVPDTLRADVEVFMRLHAERWRGRGQSDFLALGDGLPETIYDIGRQLLGQPDRFRLQLLEITGEPVSAQMFLAAGGHVLYVNGGWDERFARLRPAMLSILLTIEEAFANGDHVVDLGMVDQSYKLRFSDNSEPLAWTMLMPRARRLPRTLLSVAPKAGRLAARTAVKERMSSEQANRYRRIRGRLSGLRRRAAPGPR